MLRRPALSLVLAGALFASGCASMATPPAQVSDGALTGKNGMTLYTFDRDVASSGKSVCNGACATNWPPLMAADGARSADDYSVITRDDGGKQVAYKGKPLYYWAKDTKAGDKTGDGVNNAWRVARP